MNPEIGARRGAALYVCLVATMAVLTGAPALRGQEFMAVAQEMPGFKPISSYQDFGNGESVNLANGGLTVTHASAVGLPQNMGDTLRPVRVYNTKNPDGFFDATCGQSDNAIACGPLGGGWRISYGRVFLRVANASRISPVGYVSRSQYYYQDESGAEHRLYLDSTLEGYAGSNAKPNGNNWYVTNDLSFIRARYSTLSNEWTLYFPDGSTRVAGGAAGLYVAPTPGPVYSNGDGTTYVSGLTNNRTNGWWVRSITDRAGNAITISYYAVDAAHKYPGSIRTLTDQFGRAITFGYGAEGTIVSITGAGLVENYSYESAFFPQYSCTVPVLTKVGTSAGPEITYAYGQLPDPGTEGIYLKQIGYPTGAISQYAYERIGYTITYFPANPNEAEPTTVYTDAVKEHTVLVRAVVPTTGNGSEYALKWTYNRSFQPGYYLQRNTRTVPVAVKDPLGAEEVHFFTATDFSDGAELSPGRELAHLRRPPAASPWPTFDPNNPQVGRIWQKNTYYESGDRVDSAGLEHGDAHRCWYDGPLGPDSVPKGNLRSWKTEEREFLLSSTAEKWCKVTSNTGWDGFGHHLVSQETGTSSAYTRVTASQYDLKKDLTGTLYQLDRLIRRYAGGATYMGPLFIQTMGLAIDDPPPPTGVLAPMGQFAALTRSYGATTGLLYQETRHAALQDGFTFSYTTQTLSAPAASAGDSTTTLAYTTAGGDVGKGNIQGVTYLANHTTEPNPGAARTASFTWNRAMVQSMQWSNVAYAEFTRTIDIATSRITCHTDANGFATGFTYDALGRITIIAHPSPQAAERIEYLNDTRFYNLKTWRISQRIKYYRGSLGAVPNLTPGPAAVPTTTLPANEEWALYTFDDLGRLWRTDRVGPDNYWLQNLTLYDALGRAFFTSEPYRWDSKSVQPYTSALNGGGTFTASVPISASSKPFGTFEGTVASTLPTLSGTPDPFYRTVRVFKADGARTDLVYDGLTSWRKDYDLNRVPVLNGNVLSATTRFDKDAFGALLSVLPPAGAAATYAYDGLGKLTGVTLSGDGKTQSRVFRYDALGHLLGYDQPETGKWGALRNPSVPFTYDSVGNLLSYTDAKGQVFLQAFDAKGRLTQVKCDNTIRATYGYDAGTKALGKLTSTSQIQRDADSADRTVTQSYTYRAADGLPEGVSLTVSANGSGTPSLSYTYTSYDAMLNVTGQTLPGNQSVSQSFTHGGVLTRGLGGTPSLTFGYTSFGAVGSVTMSQGFASQVSYDAVNRPVGYSFTRSGAGIWKNGSYASASFPYQYDGLGNVISVGNMMAPASPDTYTYDALSRLTAATVRKSGTGVHALSYGYDAFGNLLQRTESAQGQATLKAFLMAQGAASEAAEGYARNVCFLATIRPDDANRPTNRLLSVTRGGTIGNVPTGVTASTATVLEDANGNVTDDGTYLYDYDPFNRLIAVKKKSTNLLVSQHLYDASGERASTIAYNATGTATSFTQYLREGAQVVYEKTWTLPGWTVQGEKWYLYGQGKMAVTKETVNGQTTLCYYGTDHLGTVRAVVGVDASGIEKTRSLHDYEPYGLEIVPLQTSSHTHRYTGHERDVLDALTSTTIDYMHFRSYASATARFLKPDNVWGSVMNPQSWNLYAYCGNNPVGRNDPTGHLSELFMREIHASPSDQGIGAARSADGTPSGDKNGEKQAEDVGEKTLGDRLRGLFEKLWDALFGGANGGASDRAQQTKALEADGIINEGEAGQTDVGAKANAELRDAAATVATEATKQVVILAATEGVGKVVEGVANLKRLTPGEIKVLKAANLDPHELKKEFGKGIDLFKDSKGNLFAAPMSGKGAAEPLNINIKDLP